MNTKKASSIWVDLNAGECPKGYKQEELDKPGVRWAEMEKVRPYASKAQVDRLWAKKCGMNWADVAFTFGKP